MMKTFNLAVASVIALVACLSSCDKKETTTTPTTNNNPATPNNQAGPQPQVPAPSGGNVSGSLVSIRMKYSSQPTGSPIPVEINSEMAVAVFYNSPGSATVADAGTVSVNNIDLEKQTNGTYLKWAYTGGTPSDLDFDNTSDWNVSGSSDVTAFTYDHSIPFPEYSGNTPAEITKSGGLDLTFSTSTVDNADSVYVVIAAGSQSVVKSYSATAGNITISASDLNALPAISDNSAVFEICPFKYNKVVKNGKDYYFIKELAVVKNININ